MRKRAIPGRSFRKRPPQRKKPVESIDLRAIEEKLKGQTNRQLIPKLIQEIRSKPSSASQILPLIEENFGREAVPWLRTLFAQATDPLRGKVLKSIREIENKTIPL